MHVSPSLCVVHPIWVLGGGWLPRGLGHNLLMQFSSLGSSKMEISETDFFDTLTIQNDQISYVKHVLAPLYVFSTLTHKEGLKHALHRIFDHFGWSEYQKNQFRKFYCLRQVHLVENLPQATHTLNRVKTT